MITPKIKALFQFIEYLHSNIDNFKQYDEVLNELYLLDKERNQLRPRKNFKDKLKYDEVQAEIKDKFKVIQENILKPIQTKATELNICDLNKKETLWNWNITEIHELKENFSKDDLPEIFNHKSKYIEYREKTKGEAFFGLGFFFDDLDELLKILFDYFKDTEQNEFEAFEIKAIQVNSIEEVIQGFKKGKTKFILPNSFLNPSTIQQQTNIEPLPPQPTIKQNNKLSDLITHQKSIEIVEGIKIQYKNIKGKRLKLLLLALQDLELLPKERISQKFFNSCKYEFDWDIASYNAMNMYKYNDITDRDEFNSMKQFLKTLIKTE
jgi:hypothetical protein